VAYGTVVKAGAAQYVSGGNVFSSTIATGGFQLISADGGGSGTVINGGSATVQLGGAVTGTVINAGGEETVGYSGTDSGGTVYTGGTMLVSSGGAAYGVVLSGGTVIVSADGTLGGSATFAGGGEIAVDGTMTPDAVISGFASGDEIDLADVAYSSSDTVTVATPGVVTISVGGTSYNLNIAGAAVGETGFTLSADTGSGTLLIFSAATPSMAFLRPAVGGSERAAMPAMMDVVTAKTKAAPAFATTATQVSGFGESLVRLGNSGGVERVVVSHSFG
jgi:autotransporter passenger strand-loop-strand repeat protein